MKEFWYSWIAAVAAVFMISPAAAQSGQIGSYQSILSKAGYSSQQSHQDTTPNIPAPGLPSAPALPSQGSGHVPHPPAAGSHNSNHTSNNHSMSTSPMGSGTHGHATQGVPFPAVQGNCATGVPSGAAIGGIGAPMNGMSSVVANGCASNGQVVVGGGPAVSGYIDGGAGCNDAVYAPGGSFGNASGGFGRGLFSGGGNTNTVVGLFGLFFDRDYEDDRPLSSNAAGQYLFSTDADNEMIGGYGVDIGRRNCNGRGIGFRYWGLDSNSSTSILSPAPLTTNVGGFMGVDLAGYNLEEIFNYGEFHTIDRETEIHNIELNLLQNGGTYTTRGGRAGNFELFGGFRWFEFDERFRYSSVRSFAGGVPAGVPDEVYLDLDTSNTLLGVQVGGRTEVCLTQRLRFAGGTRLGLFNNRITARQNSRILGGALATIAATGDIYDFESQKDDVAFIGELDAGLIYQLNNKARLNIGYRAMSVAGVALAVDQFPYDFSNVAEINRIKSNGQLLLHGGYAGLEWCY